MILKREMEFSGYVPRRPVCFAGASPWVGIIGIEGGIDLHQRMVQLKGQKRRLGKMNVACIGKLLNNCIPQFSHYLLHSDLGTFDRATSIALGHSCNAILPRRWICFNDAIQDIVIRHGTLLHGVVCPSNNRPLDDDVSETGTRKQFADDSPFRLELHCAEHGHVRGCGPCGRDIVRDRRYVFYG